jgi:hypothetical protein
MYAIKKQFQGKRLVVDGMEINAEFVASNMEAKLKAFPQLAAFVEKVEAPKK